MRESYRNVRRRNYTQVDNEMLRDKELTLEAKGLMAIFLSNTADWELNMKEIITRSKNGRDAHYRIVNELIEKGYFARIQKIKQSDRRTAGMEYFFSDIKEDVEYAIEAFKEGVKGKKIDLVIEYKVKKEKKTRKKKEEMTPLTGNQYTENFPLTENQDTGSPKTENQYINNTKEKNTNLNNTNSNNTNQTLPNQYDELNELNLPTVVGRKLKENMVRIGSDSIKLSDIEIHFQTCPNLKENTSDPINEYEYADILDNLLRKANGPIRNIKALMDSWIKTFLGFKQENNLVAFYDWLEASETEQTA